MKLIISDEIGTMTSDQIAYVELRYRRKNNIFKVGDRIIFSAMCNSVMHYDNCLEMFLSQGLIRHATGEEIKAGKIV